MKTIILNSKSPSKLFSRMNDEAEKLKAEANECFKKSDYEGAISLYDKAIEVAPEAPVLYSNRSISHLRSESPGLALKDASKGKFYFRWLKI